MKTEAMSIVDKIKVFKPARQIAIADRKKVTQVNSGSGKNFTAKDKAVVGIHDDRIISWSFPNFEWSDSEMLKQVAKASGTTVSDMLTSVAMQWVEDNHTELHEIAGEQVRKIGATEEQLRAKIDRTNKQLEKLQLVLAGKTIK